MICTRCIEERSSAAILLTAKSRLDGRCGHQLIIYFVRWTKVNTTTLKCTLNYLLTVPVLLIFLGQNTLRYSNFLRYFYLFPWKCYCGTFICCGTFIKIFYHTPGQSQGLLLQSHSDAFKVAHGRKVARLRQWKAITAMVHSIDWQEVYLFCPEILINSLFCHLVF